MIITFERLLEIVQTVESLYAKDKTLEDTKFGYAVNRFLAKNYKKIISEYQDELRDLRVEYALTDPKTNELLVDEKGNYKYDKKSRQDLIKAERRFIEAWNIKEIEIEPYICSAKPDIDEYSEEILKGILI